MRPPLDHGSSNPYLSSLGVGCLNPNQYMVMHGGFMVNTEVECMVVDPTIAYARIVACGKKKDMNWLGIIRIHGLERCPRPKP